jgi:hypothetical protein
MSLLPVLHSNFVFEGLLANFENTGLFVIVVGVGAGISIQNLGIYFRF